MVKDMAQAIVFTILFAEIIAETKKAVTQVTAG